MAVVKEVLVKYISGEADDERRAAAAEVDRQKFLNKEVPVSKSSDALVIDDNISKIEYKLAKCCSPIKGDNVFGFVTISTGITIHRLDCPNAKRMRERYPYRVIDATWRSNAEGAFRISIKIVAVDMTGMANQITEVISRDMRLNIRSINFQSVAGGLISGVISVEVANSVIAETLMYMITRIKGVQKAYRVNV